MVEDYGVDCLSACGTCNHTLCTVINGDCTKGCEKWWHGPLCDLECPLCIDGCIQLSGACVSGCVEGYRGDRCNETCPENCLTGSCDKTTGQCVPQLCKHGWHGATCENECHQNCNASTCDPVSGTCSSCSDGYYMTDCTTRCPDNCQTSQCQRDDGRCSVDECKITWFGPTCDQLCPRNCYDRSCDFSTGFCANCTVGFYGPRCDQFGVADVTPTTTTTITSVGPQSCIVGRFGPACGQLCPRNCFDRSCDFETGFCSNCTVGFSGPKCDFFVYGDVASPEKQVCLRGWYGSQCDEPCPRGCAASSCHADYGTCYSCNDGYYGSKCTNQCPGNCIDNECDQVHGDCVSGRCLSGWHGVKCAESCGNCLDISCDPVTAHCYPCVDGYYGLLCNTGCPENCLNQTCDYLGGGCVDCQPLSYGTHCEASCAGCVSGCDRQTGLCVGECYNGFYGLSCDQRCNPGCPNKACDQLTGECLGEGCAEGWLGGDCTEDLNECAVYADICPEHTKCYNIPGSYECMTLFGGAVFEGSGSGKQELVFSWVCLFVGLLVSQYFGIVLSRSVQ